jgi:hypothetical protein
LDIRVRTGGKEGNNNETEKGLHVGCLQLQRFFTKKQSEIAQLMKSFSKRASEKRQRAGSSTRIPGSQRHANAGSPSFTLL